jgi:putative oxidoreductase
MEARSKDLATSIGLLILRLGVGGYMLTHGWGKLQMLMNGAAFGDPIGLGGRTSLLLATGAEFFCALLVVLGLATRVAAAPVVFTMGVAAFVVHANDPWTMTGTGGSKEPALLFLFPFLALIFTGPGRFSLDALLWPRWRQRSGRRAAA